MYEKMDGVSGVNKEANVEVQVTYILWFDPQKPVKWLLNLFFSMQIDIIKICNSALMCIFE